MGGAGLAVRPVAQQEQGRPALHRPQAQPAAGSEIERLGRPADIGNNAGNGPAGQGFLGHPEQVAHIERAHDHQKRGIETKGRQPRAIGQAEELCICFKLQVEDGHPPGVEQHACLPQSKAETGAPVADTIGKDLLQQPARQPREASLGSRKGSRPCLGQGWLALDIGNDIAQRGKALLTTGGLHGRPLT